MRTSCAGDAVPAVSGPNVSDGGRGARCAGAGEGAAEVVTVTGGGGWVVVVDAVRAGGGGGAGLGCGFAITSSAAITATPATMPERRRRRRSSSTYSPRSIVISRTSARLDLLDRRLPVAVGDEELDRRHLRLLRRLRRAATAASRADEVADAVGAGDEDQPRHRVVDPWRDLVVEPRQHADVREPDGHRAEDGDDEEVVDLLLVLRVARFPEKVDGRADALDHEGGEQDCDDETCGVVHAS